MKIKLLPPLLVFLFAVSAASTVSAATITSTSTGGAWAAGGTWIGGAAPAATDLVVIAGGASVSTGGSRTCAGITISGTLSMANGNILTVNGDVGGTGTWSTGDNPRTISLTGNWSFNGTSTGAGAIAIFTGTGSQTLAGKITTGGGTLTVNKAGGAVTLGSAITVTTFTLTAGTFDPSTFLLTATSRTFTAGTLRVGATTWAGNYSFSITEPAGGTIVYYRAGDQTVNGVTYAGNLILAGSGAKTTTGATVNGVLSIEGTATTTGTVPTYGAAATLQYNGSGNQTTGTEFPATWNGSGGVIVANTAGTVTLGGDKVINAPVTITSGAIFDTGAANNYAVTFGGNFTNSGNFAANGSAIAISGAGTQTIDGFTTTGDVSMTKTGGTATFNGNVNGGGLTINGSGGTLNLGTGRTHAFTGTWTRSVGTLDGGSSTLNLGGSVSGTGGTFTAGSGTVNYNAAGAQTLAGVTYNNLTLSGSGAKTITGVAINGVLDFEGTATATFTGPATANRLTFAGVTQAASTWGSTSSAAVVKDDTHFASTGVLTVSMGTGPAARLAFTTQPGGGTGGTAWTTQPVVTVQDVAGNTVTTDTSTVTVAIQNNPGGGALNGTLTKVAVAGVASFNGLGLRIDKTGAGYTLTATDGSLTSASSSAFDIAVGAAAKLAFTTQPGGGTGGTAWATQPVVTVQDAGGNTVTTDTSTVTVAILNNPGGGTLSGTLTKAAVSGVANFSGLGLKIDKVGTGYSLTATDGLLTSGNSAAFNITVGVAAKLAFTTEPSTGTAGTVFSVTVQSQDAAGNPASPTSNTTVSLSKATGGGNLSGLLAGAILTSGNSVTISTPIYSKSDTLTLTATATAGMTSLTAATSGSIVFAAGVASAAHSTISPATASITADGSSTQVITVQARDANNNNLATSGGTVVISQSSGTGTIGSTTDHTDGTYTATVTSATATGTGTFTATLGGIEVGTAVGDSSSTITYIPGAADAAHSTISPTTASITADGSSTHVITIQARDVNNNNLTAGGGTVVISRSSGTGTIGSTTDHADGTYTATVTAPTATGSGTFAATLGGTAVGTAVSAAAAVVNYTPGALDHFEISAISSPQAAGADISIATITAQDANNNTVSSFGSTVNFGGTAGVTGTSAEFTAGVLSDATVTPTVAGSGLTVTVADGASHTGSITIATIDPSVTDHYTVTFSDPPYYAGLPFTMIVTAKDVYHNTVTTDSATEVTYTSSSLEMMWEYAGTYDNGLTPAQADHARRMLTNGVAAILTKDNMSETGVTITVTDVNEASGTSAAIDIDSETAAYRSKASGNWSDTTTWEVFNGSSWVDAIVTPTSSDGVIMIQEGHTVVVAVDVTADQVHVMSSAQVIVNSGRTLTIDSATTPGLEVYGTLNNAGTLTFATGGFSFVWPGGVMQNSGTINSTFQTLEFEPGSPGGKYQHEFTTTGGTVPTAEWEVGSICEIAGYTSYAGSGPGGLGQDFYDFTWNCPSQTGDINLGADFTNVANNFTVTSTGSGSLALGASLTVTNTTTVGGGAALNCGSYTLSGGAFTLSSGGTLGIGSADGITSSGAAGNVQTPSPTFNTGGNYVYNGTTAQAGGSGLPATVNSLTDNNTAGTVALTQTVTVTTSVTLAAGARLGLPDSTSSSAVTFTASGVPQAAGSWGSTGSTAVNKSDIYFAATTSGLLNVSSGPPPSAYRIAAASDTPAAGAGNQLTITLVDQYGNPVTSFSGDKELTFSGLSAAGDGTNPTVTDKDAAAVSLGTAEWITFTAGSSAAGGSLVAYKAEGPVTLAVTDGTLSTSTTGGNGVDLTIGNAGPSALTHSFTRTPSASLKILKTDLLAGATDANHDIVSFVSVQSASGNASVFDDGSYVWFLPGTTRNGATFTYTVTDGSATDTKIVTINLSTPVGLASGTISVSGGVATVTMYGIPGIRYDVQRSTDLISWTTLSASPPLNVTPPITAAADGRISFADDFSDLGPSPPAVAYYRTVYHP